MPLATGSRLGPYEVLSAIGAGGMGEVYRARDGKLGRDVALKVLPEAFARDAERMARFQREAKVLASLNHPNIATIHGLEDSGKTHALVMEMVEGPTLADRIKQGPIPIDEALRIAKQITEALEYAHERGIVHRDLKPANVKVTSDDAVKVLDFGLAKAIEGDAASIDIANSPTMSRMATLAGVLLGTAAYMSPEQAKAKPVDRRADIWAFGCVLYEMLTGKMAFRGESVTDTLAAVIKEDPDWRLLPAATPIRIRVLLQRCLQKDPKQRLRDIGDARISLEEVLSGAADPTVTTSAERSAKRPWLWIAAALAGVLLTAGGVGFAIWTLKPSPSAARPVTRTVIDLPTGQHLAGLDNLALALSPDGRDLAYVATTQGASTQQIYLRPMDSAEARPVPGTEGAIDPFFSPDGQWLGFFADGKLKKIPVNGAVAQTLGDVVNPHGASWDSEGKIAFVPGLSVLSEMSDAGGDSQTLTRFAVGESSDSWPEFLPDGKAVLFLAITPPTIAAQPVDGGQRRNLIQGQAGTMPRYATSGHLIYAQAGTLMAVPFDPQRLEVAGPAVPAVQGVLQSTELNGPAQYSVSNTGSLVYVAGNLQATQRRLVWVSRNGSEQPLSAPLRDYDQPRLSPDGRRIAVDVGIIEIGGTQVDLYDLARDTLSRFTFEGNLNQYPTWTPDGKRIAFMSGRSGALSVFWQLADGSGGLERLTNDQTTSVPFSWSPDGQLMAGVQVAPPAAPEIMVLRLADHKAQPFQQTQTGAFEDAPQFSPDGRWIAYASDESGRREIYVQPYPGPGGKWQISTDGGTEPLWNHNGRELFYRNGNRMMAVDIGTQSGFAVGKPRMLFEGPYLKNGVGYARPNYDVSPDGQRFLMIKPIEQEQAAPTQINVVLNWTEELKRLVPVEKK
ncbi:MAG TPA: protein kinase [Candidatus Acidoferrales bacterium]|nr:protein kinase [Candidatus Acidoferrales bacterium]